MALDMTRFDAAVQASINALSTTPDPKALLLLGKAIESTRPTVALSDLLAASVSQQAILGTKGNDALTALEAARVKAIQDVQAAGQGSAAASGIAFTAGGGISATNVQSAILEVDAEAPKKAANLSDLADAKAARANLGLDKLTGRGDANYTILATDRTILINAALTAPRTFTLPAASAMNPGASLRVADLVGGISPANTLTVAAAGSDTINGAASFAFAAAFTDFQLTTDGAGKWVFDVQGLARGGTGATSAAGARTNLGLGSAAVLAAGAAGGVATLDASTGKLVAAQIPDALLGALTYKGGWNASTNSPALPAPSAANKGFYYIVLTAGTTSLSGPTGAITDWQVGDWAVSDGQYWEKVDSSDQVISVAGLQGAITAADLRAALALVVGTNVQAYSTNLSNLAGQTSVAYGRSLLALADAAALANAAGVPVKAAGSDLRGLTDDAKFLTAKAMADAMAYTSPAWAATFVPDWGANGFRQSLVAAGNTTIGGPFVGGKDGEDVALEFAQDGTGSRTLAVNTTYVKLPAGLTITASTAANAVDLLTGYLRLVGSTLVLQVTGFLKGAR